MSDDNRPTGASPAPGVPEGSAQSSSPQATSGAESQAATATQVSETEGSATNEERSPGIVLKGATVSPGLVLGSVHRKDYDLARAGAERVPLDSVDQELNRFRRALDASRQQLEDLKKRLTGRVPEGDARILDTHVTYLKDSVFIADVENLILNEQMRLDAAIGKVVGDFDRIFRLVRTDTLRQSAVDLRDVGIRVLRNLERESEESDGASSPLASDYVLVAKELSIVDMFTLANEHVKGIVTQEGGMTSHAAIFARSMRIPTLIGVEGLLDTVREQDFVILDATEALLRVNPDEVVRAQYASSQTEDAQGGIDPETPDWARRPKRTRDGLEIHVAASCGNLPEVEQARTFGLDAVGLYRTELLYLIDKTPPSRESLVQHYTSVIGAAQGAPVTFRLLNVDSSMGISYLHPERERNPRLGSVGVRALLEHPAILRRQLQALMIAAVGAEVRLALPFVTDCADLRRVKEILFDERVELRKEDTPFEESLTMGVVIETPTSMLGLRDLAKEADFLMLNLDSLQQNLLAVDREDPKRSAAIDSLHPYVLRALKKAGDVAEKESRPLWVFGQASRIPENLGYLVGAGLRHFCVPPADLRTFLEALDVVDTKVVARATSAVASRSCAEEASTLVAEYHHGYAPD